MGLPFIIGRSRKRLATSPAEITVGSALPVERKVSGSAFGLSVRNSTLSAPDVFATFTRKTRQPCSASSGFAGPAVTSSWPAACRPQR